MHAKSVVIDNLILTCKDEILNTRKTAPNVDKKVINKKNDWLIQIVSLAIICSFLVKVLSNNCFFYYTKYYLRNKNVNMNINYI